MSRETPERYRWAADLLDVQPDDRVLEIGCGLGHMADLVCERLTSGRVIAIDRSAKMVDAARERNAGYIAAGKAQIFHQDLIDSQLDRASFDKIFLFNINAFWMDPVAELREVKRLLKPKGLFHIFHEPPPGHEIKEFIDRFEMNLTRNGFEVASISVEEIETKEMAWLVSRPSPR